jgi:hypothetical protein
MPSGSISAGFCGGVGLVDGLVLFGDLAAAGLPAVGLFMLIFLPASLAGVDFLCKVLFGAGDAATFFFIFICGFCGGVLGDTAFLVAVGLFMLIFLPAVVTCDFGFAEDAGDFVAPGLLIIICRLGFGGGAGFFFICITFFCMCYSVLRCYRSVHHHLCGIHCARQLLSY